VIPQQQQKVGGGKLPLPKKNEKEPSSFIWGADFIVPKQMPTTD
jgi:hypothetical protein